MTTLSIIIPTLDAAATLPATLASCAGAEAELVVVDGGSTDGTMRVAAAALGFGIARPDLGPLLLAAIELGRRVHHLAVRFVLPPRVAVVGGDHVGARVHVARHALAGRDRTSERVLERVAGLLFVDRRIGRLRAAQCARERCSGKPDSGRPGIQPVGDVELWEVVHRAKWQRHDFGHALYRRGEEGNDFHIIAKGELEVFRDGQKVDAGQLLLDTVDLCVDLLRVDQRDVLAERTERLLDLPDRRTDLLVGQDEALIPEFGGTIAASAFVDRALDPEWATLVF